MIFERAIEVVIEEITANMILAMYRKEFSGGVPVSRCDAHMMGLSQAIISAIQAGPGHWGASPQRPSCALCEDAGWYPAGDPTNPSAAQPCDCPAGDRLRPTTPRADATRERIRAGVWDNPHPPSKID